MLYHCAAPFRNRFTTADLEFIASVIAPDEQRMHLEKLWSDPIALREMLDHKEVFRAVLNSPATLRISARFYFHVLVRHAFLQAGLADAALADHVSGVMAKRLCPSADDPLENISGGFTRASDFISIIDQAHGRMRFHLQVAAGNQFLMLTGLYPEFLNHRSETTGGPSLEYYENFARQAYRGAADNREGAGPQTRKIFGTLAEVLPTARLSLNRMAEELVFLGT
ncbi:MAG: hypothetical protein V4640_13725 [Verrucomicrobiota bacterium]